MRLIILNFTFLISLAAISASAAEVKFLAQGSWTDTPVTASNGDISLKSNVWMDMKVENLSYHKDVAIIWTSNDWLTVNESSALFETTLADGREQWGADILGIGALDQRYFGVFWDHAYDHDAAGYNWLDGSLCDWVSKSCKVTIKYAIRYINLDNGNEYWDNNNGNNYSLSLSVSLL